ncbi:MAG: complex I NDUFA9 subunit family protein [Halofilum sp. (in: g-proteobacteria)]
MSAIVFGGTGFLGRAVVTALAGNGWRIRVAARHPDTHASPHASESCAVDVRDEDAVAAALEGMDVVVNTVSLYVERDGLDFDAIHVRGAERVARLAAASGATRLVHVSGIGVDRASASRYVRARADGELAVRAVFPGATVVRPSVIFGPHDHFLSTLDTVTRLPIIPLFADGGMRLQPVHVDDVAQAIAASLFDPAAAATVFELGGAEILRYRDILHAVLRHRGRRRLLLPVPFAIWRIIARVGALLPDPPVTMDQLELLAMDNGVGDAPGFADLGITPRGLTAALPACLGATGAAPGSGTAER